MGCPQPGNDVDAFRDIVVDGLPLGDVGRSLWEPALPHLSRALTGDEDLFLGAVEGIARGAALCGRIPITDLLAGFSAGCDAVRAETTVVLGTEMQPDVRGLAALEHVALTRLAAGYSAGLEETITRLRRAVQDASPLDEVTGAIKPRELCERLSLEADRCRRMDLPLGLVALDVLDAVSGKYSSDRGCGCGTRRRIGEALCDNLRRYDSVGLTPEGAFLLVLPDISRRGLTGTVERLRRQLGECADHASASSVVVALAHYDFVDASAAEMLDGLRGGVHHARDTRETPVWC